MKRLKEHGWLKEMRLHGEERDIMAFVAMLLKMCCHEGQERDDRAGKRKGWSSGEGGLPIHSLAYLI